MAKVSHDTGCKACMCNKCGMEAHSMPNTPHRRCTGEMAQGDNKPLSRPKHDLLPGAQRGRWE